MMKRLIPVIAILLGWAAAAWATAPAAPVALTTLSAIHALSNSEASEHSPVDFEATVTYFRWYTRELFVQDGNTAIFIFLTKDIKLAPGDRIRIRGIMQPSFHPLVQTDDITVIGHADLPQSVPASYNQLVHNVYDCRRVTVRAVVHSADLIYRQQMRSTYMQLIADGNILDVSVETDDPESLKDLLDAEVEVTGVSTDIFDSKMQQTGTKIQANTMADVKILKRAGSSPWTLPVTPMNDIYIGRQVREFTARMRVHGTITYYQPGEAVVLQDAGRSLWIETQTNRPLRIGDLADATGFPDAHNGFLNLARGEFLDSGTYAPIPPQPATWESLSSSNNVTFGHIYDLVSIEGQVVTEAREAERDEYVLNSKGRLFTAIYYHSDKASQIPLPPLKQIPIGAIVRVTGICGQLSSNPWNGTVPFDILLRSYDDIAVVVKASWLTVRNLALLVIALLLAVIVVGAWGVVLMRKVHGQTTAIAALAEAEASQERRRSSILEDINGSRPLAEIIEEIAAMVSSTLNGAPCWCQIADGALLGNCPPKLTGLRIVEEKIHSHTGPALGTIFAAFDPLVKPRDNESESISMAVALTALAIETRRLYADLLHRSEFDLLTDIHNRFSLDKYLDRQIDEARQNAGIFGLIYIDLDKFKQINDVYGHQFGDLYLQAVALRMKRQLRNVDMLARFGGDEFAVLLPVVHNRAKVEEIAQRLERSFDEPFSIEGQVFHGAASIGFALYPEDGATKDSLLSAADAAMYAAKHSKRQAEENPA
jgi:diguanylate cyclase (GGDEF)-like protein